MKHIGAKSSSATARLRSPPWATRAPASGASRGTSFVSIPDKNRAEAATRSGPPERTWSLETKPRVCLWRVCCKNLRTNSPTRTTFAKAAKNSMNERWHIARFVLLAAARFGSGVAAEVAGREGPALHRIRAGDAQLLRGVGVGEKSQAATRGSPAAGSGHRTAIRSHMTHPTAPLLR